jgi:hypothetical protein
MFTIGTIASTALSATGNIMQGNQAAAMGRAQQLAYNQAAEAQRVSSSYEATRVAEQGRRAQAAGFVETAGSGVLLTGSPTDVLADNAIHTQNEIDAIRFGSMIKEGNLRTQGALALLSGDQRQQAGYIGAATNVASGLTQLYTPRTTDLAALYTPRAAVRFGGSSFPASGMTATGAPY